MRSVQLLPSTLPSHSTRTGTIIWAHHAKGAWTLRVRLDACGLFVTVPLDGVRYL